MSAWKVSRKVMEICDRFFVNGPGICDTVDCPIMSACKQELDKVGLKEYIRQINQAAEGDDHVPRELTYQIAHAAAWDEGNRHMRKHGRSSWNEDDYNAAVAKLLSLLKEVPDENVQVVR